MLALVPCVGGGGNAPSALPFPYVGAQLVPRKGCWGFGEELRPLPITKDALQGPHPAHGSPGCSVIAALGPTVGPRGPPSPAWGRRRRWERK